VFLERIQSVQGSHTGNLIEGAKSHGAGGHRRDESGVAASAIEVGAAVGNRSAGCDGRARVKSSAGVLQMHLKSANSHRIKVESLGALIGVR
jgi:hypothetical protein